MVDVKICGLCRPEDGAAAVVAGASHVGVILTPGFARTQPLDRAAEIFAATERLGAPAPRRVGVFVNAPVAVLQTAAEALRLDVVQLHGKEAAGDVAEVRTAGSWSVWKALHPRTRAELLAGLTAYADVVDGILLDGLTPHGGGGMGATFPWAEVEAVRSEVRAGIRLIVAGGLNPENVGQAVRRLAPEGVDVSSGVESELGRKSVEKMRAFVLAARA